MAKQTGESILAELKELNNRLGRIEQLLQPRSATLPPPAISGGLNPDKIKEAVANVLQGQTKRLSFA